MELELQYHSPYEGGGVGQHAATAGFAAAQRNANSRRRAQIREAARLFANVYSGREEPVFLREAMNPRNEVLVRYLGQKYPALYGNAHTDGGRIRPLQETMSVTDYKALYVDVLDRMYYGYYNTFPVVNRSLVKEHPLRDFRNVSRYLLDGMVTPLTAQDPAEMAKQRAMTGPVPQGGATQATADTGPIQYAPLLYQAMASVNWRAFVNDDLGIFNDMSNRLAIAANRGISKFISSFYINSGGPNSDLFKSAYGNLITTAYGSSSNNPRLSSQGLMDAFKILAGMKDSGGDPIIASGTPIVWFGPAYNQTAAVLRNQLTTSLSVEGGSQNAQGFPTQWIQVNNYLVQNVQWVEDKYIPTIAPNYPYAWGIIMAPGSQARPAIEVGFLRGFDTPQLYTKVPNTARIGGGVDETMGDFYTMDQELKIITVMGGTVIDGRTAVASNGSQS